MKTVAERITVLENLKDTNKVELKTGLVKALRDRSPTIRGLAVEIIGDEELNGLLSNILPFLWDSSSEVRLLVIESIGKLTEGKTHTNKIADCLNDKDELVRVYAAEFLGEFGDVSILDKLEIALNDKSALVRRYVAESIGSIGESASAVTLEKYLLNEKDDLAKVGFCVGLHKLNKSESLDTLIKLLDSEDYRVRCAVANSFSTLNLASAGVLEITHVLHKALLKEKTVAARSSIESTLSYLQG